MDRNDEHQVTQLRAGGKGNHSSKTVAKGIVSELGHPRRSYRIGSKGAMDRYVDPGAWQAETDPQDGSWWEPWAEWLGAHSDKQTAPPDMGNAKSGYAALTDAPGTYVLQK